MGARYHSGTGMNLLANHMFWRSTIGQMNSMSRTATGVILLTLFAHFILSSTSGTLIICHENSGLCCVEWADSPCCADADSDTDSQDTTCDATISENRCHCVDVPLELAEARIAAIHQCDSIDLRDIQIASAVPTESFDDLHTHDAKQPRPNESPPVLRCSTPSGTIILLC